MMALVAGTALVTSCMDQLEKVPVLGQTESTFYRTASDAEEALVAAYDPLQWNFTTDEYHFRWFYGDICSDDAIKGGSGQNDLGQVGQLEEFVATPTNRHVNASYEQKYAGIYRANIVIEKVPEIDMDETRRAQIVAEAKFLRAYYFFELVTLFGGVPPVDHTLAPSEYEMSRATPDDIWAIIEQDLTDAAADLPEKSELAGSQLGRATRGAALALLGKSHLYQEEWQDAADALSLVERSGEYDLDPDYAHIFTEDGEHGIESVFEISRSPSGGGNWGNVNGSNEGNMTNVFQRARGQFGGWGFNIPTQDLVDEYEAGDPRLGQTIFREGDQMGDRGIFTKENASADYDYYSRKYFMNQADQDRAVGDPLINGISNDRIIRYADVLLMYAEALYHLSDEPGARTQINAVRARARAGGSPFLLPDVTASGQALLDAIYHERRVELAMEGHRFFDLVRWGLAPQKLDGFVSGTHEVFPIPFKQIQLNPALEQNPGYL